MRIPQSRIDSKREILNGGLGGLSGIGGLSGVGGEFVLQTVVGPFQCVVGFSSIKYFMALIKKASFEVTIRQNRLSFCFDCDHDGDTDCDVDTNCQKF